MRVRVRDGAQAIERADAQGVSERKISDRLSHAHASLSHARGAGGARASTVVVMDGAVACMAVPQGCAGFEMYANCVYLSVRDALSSGIVVVLTFDEPEAVSNAKKLEQVRRDACSKKRKIVTCSNDLAPPSPPLDYDRAELRAQPSMHELREHRPTRAKIFDEVALYVLERATKVISQWKTHGHNAGALLIDGVDPRGAERPCGERRAPVMLGTDAELVKLFEHEAIGEGDIKLGELERRVRALQAEEHPTFSPVRLIQHNTIDSDAIVLGVLGVARRGVARECATAEANTSLHALVCMRERRAKDAWAGEGATYTTIDVCMLEGQLQRYMWGISHVPTPHDLMASALAFAAVAAICGCDYVAVKGANFPFSLEALPMFVKTESTALARIGLATQPNDEVARQAAIGVRTLCCAIGSTMCEKPRYGRQAASVREASEELLLKTTWAISFWAGRERVADLSWGFAPAPAA